MAQTISQGLIARFGADLSGFKKGLNSAVRQSETAGRRIKANIGKASAAAVKLAKSVGLVALALTGLGALAVREFVQWEAAMVGVAKTVDATDEQIKELGQSFVRMSEAIPVSANELAKLGEVAGQLGVELPDIRAFVETAAALGVTTNLMAEEAATGLARFSNVMGTAVEDVGRLGSTIVDLGNSMATTEREILDMAQRITASGRIIKLTEAEVLSFAAAFTSLGLRSEEGGTAISRVMVDMANAVRGGTADLKTFAHVAGASVGDFQRLFEENAAEAVIQFVEGLDRLDKAGENVFATLESLGFQNVRVRNLLLSAGAGADKVRAAVDRGNIAWRENTALTEEAEKFYNRLGARLVQVRNKIDNVAAEIGERLTPIVDASIGVLSSFLDKVREAGPALAGFAETAGAAIPAMAEKVVNSIGTIGLKLLSVVEFFRDNPLAGGMGLVGLVFLGPTGAAVLGTIGFVIDALVAKLGGPTTVAEKLTEEFEKAERRMNLIANQLDNLRTGGPILPEFVGVDSDQLAEMGKEAVKEMNRLRNLTQNLVAEDFLEIGQKGPAAFDMVTDSIRRALEQMEAFQATVSTGGGLRDLPETVAETTENLSAMNHVWATFPPLTEEVTANLKKSTEQASLFSRIFKDKILSSVGSVVSTISDGIGNAIGDIITGVQSLSEAFTRLGQTIIREVISQLIRAVIISAILGAVLPGGGAAAAAVTGNASGFLGFAKGGVVPGVAAEAVPIIAHAGEVVLNRKTVASLGGPQAADRLNRGPSEPPASSRSMSRPQAAAERVRGATRVLDKTSEVSRFSEVVREVVRPIETMIQARPEVVTPEPPKIREVVKEVIGSVSSLPGRVGQARQAVPVATTQVPQRVPTRELAAPRPVRAMAPPPTMTRAVPARAQFRRPLAESTAVPSVAPVREMAAPQMAPSERVGISTRPTERDSIQRIIRDVAKPSDGQRQVGLDPESIRQLAGSMAAPERTQASPVQPTGQPPQPNEVTVSVDFPDAGSLPNPIDFGIIASQPAMIRLFSEMMKQARWVGTVR